MIDLRTACTTKQFAEELNIDEPKLRAFVSTREWLQPPSWENRLIWTAEIREKVIAALEAEETGCCPNCGFNLRTGSLPAEPTAGSDSGGPV